MLHLAKELKIDTNNEKTGIIQDDESTTREEWNIYFIYLCYLIDFGNRIKKLTKIGSLFLYIHLIINLGKEDHEEELRRNGTNIIEMNEGFLYKLIFRKAIGDANVEFHKQSGWMSDKQKLKTLWDRMGFPNPIPPFTDYFTTTDEKEDKIWRRYEINEKSYRFY